MDGTCLMSLRQKFGLSKETLEKMFHHQKGRCVICLLRKAEALDHDHDTGAYRDLLCYRCNLALEMLHDDPLILLRMAFYIKRHKANPKFPPSKEERRRAFSERVRIKTKMMWKTPGFQERQKKAREERLKRYWALKRQQEQMQ